MSKLAVNFIGAIGSRAGSLDSFLGAGLAVSDCNNDKDAKLAASISGIGGFLSNFPSTLGRVGNFLGLASSLRNIEVAVKTRNISHIKLNDIYSLGAAVAGLTGASYLAATLSVGGLILTLSDLVGSGGSQGQCNNKNKTPPTPGDLVQPKDSPNPGPAGDVPLGCPLIIDMDKNGIKTISVNKNVLFDLDNNLFAENTGWVGEGDALLVWDRDNNGFIDSGNELFGNHTMLANGDKAANGFIALHSLDSNGDNIFDAKDDKWLTLQLWFDHNQNGISEDGELVKLSESGIKSIDLSYRNIDITDENENVHRQISRVTWENGEESDITDVWFKKNSSKSFYKEQIDVSEDIKEMPNIVAFGNLLNLHEAMVKSPHLVYVIQEYIDSSFEDRKQLLEHLIYEWTGVSHITSSSRGNFIDARKLHSLEILFGEEFRQRGINLNPNRAAAEILEKEFNKFASYVMAQLESKTIYRDLFSITSFNINSEGGLEFDWSKLNSKIEDLVRENNLLEAKHILSIYKNIGIYNNDYQVEINKNLSALSEHRKEIAYLINSFLVEGSLKDDILKGSNDDDILIGKLGNDTINAGAGNDVLVGGRGNDVMRGGFGADTYIFSKGHGQDLIYENSDSTHRARDIDTIRFTDVSSQEVKFRRLGNDLMLFGYHETDSITIKYFYDHIDYQIDRFAFSDRTVDLPTLIAEGIHFYGTEGDDEMKDHQAWGSIFEGGRGNDVMRGGFGADTYIFSKGHGQDLIYENSDSTHRARDIDTIRFTDVSSQEVKFRRLGNDLMLFGYHETDSITIKYFYDHIDYQIDRFAFSDRTVDLPTLIAEGIHFYGTDGDDEMKDHQAWGSIFEGGRGNDVMRGGLGADTYIFSKGHGQDLIYENSDSTHRARDIDTIRFTDVSSQEVKFRRLGNDLMLFGYHETDSITIKYFYDHIDYQINRFEFTDKIISLEELAQQGMKLFGTEEADNIKDWHYNSIIEGQGGDDLIEGNGGDDTLIGGLGNDKLKGGFGADTYIFSKGHGQDLIYENSDSTHRARDIDTIRFTDVSSQEVKFRRLGNDLMLFGYHETDSITIKYFYDHIDYQIDRFAFSDRTVDLPTLIAEGIHFYGTDGDDEMKDHQAWGSIFEGGRGNDVMRGGLGADTYIFSKGHGQDLIYENSDSTHRARDIDTIRFTDVSSQEVKFRRLGNDLMLFGYHETDSITIKYFYDHIDYQINRFEFTDKIISLEELAQQGMKLFGTEEADNIKDWHYNSIIEGQGGDDLIEGNGGDDTLIGGLGNDKLKGGFGADTYIFSKGHGQDLIYENSDSTHRARDIDTIRFTDVSSQEVKFRRLGNDLMLFGYHETDSITIKYFYDHIDYQIDRFAFSDRTVDLPTLIAEGIHFYGTEGDDEMKDHQAWGSIFEGGRGNDVMRGGLGADTYIFSKGHGQDRIYEDASSIAEEDIIRFVDIYTPEILWFSRKGEHLMISNLDTSDSVIVNNWYRHRDYQIERIELANGQSINQQQLDKLVSSMAAFETQYVNDASELPREAMKEYISMLAVNNYYV